MMKKLSNKPKGVVKGAIPSGSVINLLVYVTIFLIAGMLVMLTVH